MVKARAAAERPSRPIPIVWVLVGTALLIFAVVLYFTPLPRVYSINAIGRSATLTFSGTARNAWLLPKALICVRRGERSAVLQTDRPDYDALCTPTLFEHVETGEIEMVWPDGAEAVVSRSGAQQPLEIVVLASKGEAVRIDGRELSPQSRIVVASEDWSHGSLLPFSAVVALGDVPAPGSRYALTSGSYEVRENGWTGERPEPVLEGNLFPGDRVQVVHGDAPVNVLGFIEPIGPESLGFRTVFYNDRADAELLVERFAAEPIRIGPSWIDRALHDPIFLAITTIAAFVGAVVLLLSLVWTLITTGPGEALGRLRELVERTETPEPPEPAREPRKKEREPEPAAGTATASPVRKRSRR